MKKLPIFLSLVTLFTCVVTVSHAQVLSVKSLDELIEVNTADTARILPLESFIGLVLRNHPIVKQADLLPESAKQGIRLAKGAFDPKIEASWDVKNFDDKEYYDFFNTTLKVPTWFPVDPKVTFDRNFGEFVNPENSIPAPDNFRQVTAGVSLPIGRGLLIDQRRATVKQAEIYSKITDAERLKMINKVLLSASKDYWEWYFSFYNYLLIEESLSISETIYNMVRQDFEFGEAAAIDTVRAATSYQQRQVDRRNALIDFKRAGLILSNYIWSDDESPLVLQDDMVPQLDLTNNLLITDIPLDSLVSMALERHPELVKTSLKLEQLDIDRRLAKENLKPTLDLNYNLINSPINAQGEFVEVQLRNNYKFGVNFGIPLFLRKERSKLRQTQIKIKQTGYQLNLQEREIVNDIQASYFELDNTQDMLELMNESVDFYKRIFELEILNLELGESDLFKINFQQDKLLDAQIKLMKMRANMEKARVGLFWSAGLPYLNFNQDSVR
ncbi:TolC family protein [Roseivirga sp.]|uniref:TolC family protein n=1 Tax=Roseivirga sp. TaxID=1964215 RepID=UPI003B8E1433